MKIKNNYIIVFIIWAVATLFDTITALINFINGDTLAGCIFLILAVAFSFTSGSLLMKAVFVHIKNKEAEFLQYVHEELRKEAIKNIEPFDGFEENL